MPNLIVLTGRTLVGLRTGRCEVGNLVGSRQAMG
jgi:hypothetical protein